MIRRELHDEGSRLAGERLGLLEHDARDDDREHTQEVGTRRYPRRAAEDRAGHHSDKGHFCTAGDKCGRHDRHAAVALILYGTRRHDTGDAAACTDQDRDKALTGQTETAEDTVEYKSDTSHIAARLEEREQEEQHQHLRYESEHRAYAGDDTVEDKS